MTTRFTGKERDAETGLDYFGARYMSAAQGRFTSVDPSMRSIVITNPQSWNRYTYAYNRPLYYVDRNGQWPTLPGFRGHNHMTGEALPGLPPRQLAKLAALHEYADRKEMQTPGKSYMHGMRDGRYTTKRTLKATVLRPMQSPEEASRNMTDMVNDSVARAQGAQAAWESAGNEGISDLAFEELIDALHAVQDQTSPEHSGFQGWGTDWDFGLGHAVREAAAAHTNQQAWQSGIDATRMLFLRVFGESRTAAATKAKEQKEEVTSTIKYYVP